MSYTKYTWVTGEVITADKLNHMEDGISTAGVKVFEWGLNEETHLPRIDATPDEMEVGAVIIDKLAPNNSSASFVAQKYLDDEHDNADTIVTIGVSGNNVVPATFYYDETAGGYKTRGLG